MNTELEKTIEETRQNIVDRQIKDIRQAIHDYYYDLDRSKHAIVAMNSAFNKICRILGEEWVRGKELKERAHKTTGDA